MLGVGTVLAKWRGAPGGAATLAIDGNEERIPALLAVAYGRAVDRGVIDHIRRASRDYRLGETCLALIHPARTGLPALEDRETAAYRLILAHRLLESGVTLQ